MNIAFYTTNECCPEIGGTERTTSLVAGALKNIYGHKIFSIYSRSVTQDAIRFKFEDSLRIKSRKKELTIDFSAFIKKNNIRIIINQGDFYLGQIFNDCIKEEKINCRQIFALHFSPGSLESFNVFKICVKNFSRAKNFQTLLKLITYPIYNMYRLIKIKHQYCEIYKNTDKVVLLSDKYVKQWCEYAHMTMTPLVSGNFISIPNALSFDKFANNNDIHRKDRKILIVSRLNERQKNISKALTIWKKISDINIMKDWQLDIVGDGPDKDLYLSFVEKNRIPRVNFYGTQDPQPFYKRSAIYMMTSAFEGLPMTLLEASQFGVVPLAFNTFSALPDIIEDEVNGFIIKPDDYDAYELRILELVENNELRIQMAKNAVENSKRYTIDKIAKQWQNLIISLIS